MKYTIATPKQLFQFSLTQPYFENYMTRNYTCHPFYVGEKIKNKRKK